MIVSTPANPMKIALQRQTPTTCPRSGTGVMCLVIAYRLADPSSVSPFEYFGIPVSFALGWLFFSEAPFDVLFPGILFIVGAGMIIMARERREQRRVAARDRA